MLVTALLPVQHPALDLSMRLYLGSNLLIILVGYLIGSKTAIKNIYIFVGWLLVPVCGIVLLAGFEASELIPNVSTTLWGGLLVTILLAAGGILLSFPLGIALAFGRRSSLPVVSAFSTIFIETIRGVPLVTILFMFSIILALFLPAESRIDRLVRALMAVTVFSAAYSAENVRGGLQSVPLGQIEAAKALGMGNLKTTVFIVLPQALRAVLPAIVGQFISLFKDTTLVVIIGINDFLGIGRSIINSDPEFVQMRTEVYIFMAVVYWIFSYLMSLASRRMEAAMGISNNL
jgi:general L-amino acid transport system permease protein